MSPSWVTRRTWKSSSVRSGHARCVSTGSTRFTLLHPFHQHDEAGTGDRAAAAAGEQLGSPNGSWDYLYEPDREVVIDEVLVRYVEALIYQAVARTWHPEQSARMVAMKNASDNAKNVIGELQLSL